MDFVQVNPALSLAGIFDEAELFTHSDGLMTYSPTRRALPLRLGQRLAGLVHLDLVPGLRPQMLTEYAIPQRTVPLGSLRTVFDEVVASAPVETGGEGRPTALVLGQYLSSLGLLSVDDESRLYQSMVVEAARRGAEVCVFKPHPAGPPAQTVDLGTAARRAGVDLVIDSSPEVAELTMWRRKPHWVLSCFSTGLSTAQYLMGLEAAAVGTSALLPTLAPYENSNRVPLVLSEALFHRGDFIAPALAGSAVEGPRHAASRDLQRLVEAVAYCMQPTLHPELAVGAAEYLELLEQEPDLLALFFKRKRLTMLDLPGALPRRRRLLRQR